MMAAGRGNSGLGRTCSKQKGFQLVSIAFAQLLFFPDSQQKCLPLTPTKQVFLSGSKLLGTQLKKTPMSYTTIYFISDMVLRLPVSPAPYKYDCDKYFTCLACAPLLKTSCDLRPRRTGQTGSAAFPLDCSNRAKCYCSTGEEQSTLGSSVNPNPIFNYGWGTSVLTEILKIAQFTSSKREIWKCVFLNYFYCHATWNKCPSLL